MPARPQMTASVPTCLLYRCLSARCQAPLVDVRENRCPRSRERSRRSPGEPNERGRRERSQGFQIRWGMPLTVRVARSGAWEEQGPRQCPINLEVSTSAAVFDPRENSLRPRLVRDRLIAPFWGLSREVGV